MTPAKKDNSTELTHNLLKAFDDLNHGPHSGYRPAHAKGILISGRFLPSPEAAKLTRAPHAQSAPTTVTVRFSDATGIPNIPDSDPNASPRGMAIRFQLGEHVHTDIIAHTVDGFPTRTADEFLEFLRAAYASGPGAVSPSPIERFLGTHPAALAFVQAPKPFPASFFKETFYSVSAHCFINSKGDVHYGRYRIRPEGAGEYMEPATAAQQAPNFLFDEVRQRLAGGPVKMRIMLQIAAPGDVVDDSTAHWPNDRPEIEFGSLEVTSVLANDDAEQQHIIFDPIPRVDGIESSGDPLLDPRADLYLASGRRRRADGPR